MCKVLKYNVFLFVIISAFVGHDGFAFSSSQPYMFHDIGVSAITADQNHMGEAFNPNEVTLHLQITNYGSFDLDAKTVVPVGVDFDDIATVFEFVTLPSNLPAGSRISLPLQTSFDFSSKPEFDIAAYTLLPGDNAFQHENGWNDTLCVKLNVFQLLETFAGNWIESSEEETPFTEPKTHPDKPVVLSLFPNPATHHISLETNPATNNGLVPLEYDITDLRGAKIAEGKLKPHTSLHQIDLDGFQEGLYLLSVMNGEERQILKFHYLQP